jgi:hypothetical protein
MMDIALVVWVVLAVDPFYHLRTHADVTGHLKRRDTCLLEPSYGGVTQSVRSNLPPDTGFSDGGLPSRLYGFDRLALPLDDELIPTAFRSDSMGIPGSLLV